jgi:hypothetical protein
VVRPTVTAGAFCWLDPPAGLEPAEGGPVEPGVPLQGWASYDRAGLALDPLEPPDVGPLDPAPPPDLEPPVPLDPPPPPDFDPPDPLDP